MKKQGKSIAAGIMLGLSPQQVQAANFGYHTIEAIKGEIAKGVSLDDAFAKYCGLNHIQIEGMTELGLNREQVRAENFGYHTIEAIKDIQKRTQELSSAEVFEMVKEKSNEDTQEYVKAYLKNTKKAQKPINEMAVIRVIVNTGRGFGHQRAAITLMQKLREIGFKGIFDIQCNDKLGKQLINTETGEEYRNDEPLVSPTLIKMIPDCASVEPNSDRIRVVNGLGALKISSFPEDYISCNLGLPAVDLAVCAAEDSNFLDKDKKARIFNARSYIGLQPTDWRGVCFVTDLDGVVTELPSASIMRLSSMATYQLADISSMPLSMTEQRIIDITRSPKINSQLVYGLYPDMCFNIESQNMQESGNLDEATEMRLIVEANRLLSSKTGKPSVLLVPQTIALDENFINKVKNKNTNIHVVNLTETDLDLGAYGACDVVVAYTGKLQQAVFDYLMLKGTTLPPVIEGCNARETCESAGRPFIYGSTKHVPLKQYEVESTDKQALHAQASLCLKQGDSSYLSQLVKYMDESLTSNPQLMAYQMQRRDAFFRRPDACEVALNALGIKYEVASSQELSMLEKIKLNTINCNHTFFSHNEVPIRENPLDKKTSICDKKLK